MAIFGLFGRKNTSQQQPQGAPDSRMEAKRIADEYEQQFKAYKLALDQYNKYVVPRFSAGTADDARRHYAQLKQAYDQLARNYRDARRSLPIKSDRLQRSRLREPIAPTPVPRNISQMR